MSAATSTHHSDVSPSPKAEFFQFTNLGPVLFGLIIGGATAIILCLAIAFFGSEITKERLMYAWLFAFACCFTVSIGGLFWVLVHHAVDAEWSVVVRRILENVAASFFGLWIFFLPILFFAPTLYTWMHGPPVGAFIPVHFGGHPEDLYWLSRSTWTARTAIALVFFLIVAWVFRKWSTNQDPSGDPRWSLRMRRLSFVVLPFCGLIFTFAGVDWLMSLNPHWYSTMWGVYLFAGSAWSGMAVLVLLTYWLQQMGYLRDIVTVEHYQIMGKLLLTFTVFWAYIGFSQYFLYWYGNIPEEVEYFRRRNTESWNILNTLLVVCHFIIPFLYLLCRRNKRDPIRLVRISLYAVFIHLLDLYIVVIPAAPTDENGFTFGTFFLSVLCLVAIAAPLGFLFLRNLAKHSLYPMRDPRVIASLKLVN